MSKPPGRGWEDLRAAIGDRIRAREWAPGALMPGETQLAADYHVARATVNRALQSLADDGLIERRKRAGTRVAALPVRRARLVIEVIRREVEALGQPYSLSLLTQCRLVAPVPVSARLGLPEDPEMLFLETLHLANGRPHAFETRWLNPAVLPTPIPDFAAISANEWLVANVALVSGDITFSAEAALPREASVLGLPIGTPVFVTERTTHGTMGPITLVRLVHGPGHSIRLDL